jgi:hypothetical protein
MRSLNDKIYLFIRTLCRAGRRYSAEDYALPAAILKQVEKDTKHRNIYIIDSGIQSTRTSKAFD